MVMNTLFTIEVPLYVVYLKALCMGKTRKCYVEISDMVEQIKLLPQFFHENCLWGHANSITCPKNNSCTNRFLPCHR